MVSPAGSKGGLHGDGFKEKLKQVRKKGEDSTARNNRNPNMTEYEDNVVSAEIKCQTQKT